MAYSSLHATLGSKGQRKTERAARKARTRPRASLRSHRTTTELSQSTGRKPQRKVAQRNRRRGGKPSHAVKRSARSAGKIRERAKRQVRSVAREPRASLPKRSTFDASFRAVSPETRSRYGAAAARRYEQSGITPPKSVQRYADRKSLRTTKKIAREGRREREFKQTSELQRAVEIGTLFIPGTALVKGGRAAAGALRGAKAAKEARAGANAARVATRSPRATRAATAGTKGGRARSPRSAPRPAGKPKYGRSSGKRGPATRKPTEKAKPNARTPKRAIKGRSRRKIERGYSRKPRRQTIRKGAQVGGATTSGAAALDAAALSRGEDPEALEKVANVATAPYQLGRTAVEEPGKFFAPSKLRDTILGVPQALYETGKAGVELAQGDTEEAGKLLKKLAKDYERRYGPLVEGDMEKFRKRAAKAGVAAYGLDALVAAPPTSRLAGSLARRGALGAKAQRVATKARPKLRVAADRAEPQRRSKGLAGAAAQEALDRARRRAGEKRTVNRGEGRARAIEAESPDEVVHLTRRGAAKAQRRDVAARKSRSYLGLQTEQGDIARAFQPRIAELSKRQREALNFAVRFGVRDAKTARRIVDRRIAQIRKTRTEKNMPSGLDEIPALERIARNSDEIFDEKFTRLASDLRRAEKRHAVGDPVQGPRRRRDPALNTEQATLRRYRQQADLLGITRREGESNSAWISRARTEARKAGLDEAGYVTSEMARSGPRGFAEYALGGFRASHKPKRYTGRTFREGVESTDPQVIMRGLARNVKRRFNWRLVADTFDTHTPKWGRNKPITELVKELRRRGIDESEVAFWNPAMFRERAGAAIRRDEGDGFPDDLGEDAFHDALVQSTLKGDAAADLAAALRKGDLPSEFKNTKGWSIVPRDAFNELSATTRPSGPVARSFDMAIQKSSRYLLGANPPWLISQVVSNAALAGLTKAGPTTWVKANLWYRKLPTDVKRDVDAFIGGGPFQNDVRVTRIGGAADKLPAPVRQMVNGYRGMKETVAGKAIFGGRAQVRHANPLDLMFRADNAQNNFFRRAVLYKEMNRSLYRDMGKQIGRAGAMQTRLTNILRLDPKDQLAALARDPRLLERHAEAVRDFLGDYTTYTARERRVFKRSVMFYGYLRFATRFAFLTMPLKHPVMTGLMGNLARLEANEIKELFGGDVMPFALGQIYIDDGKLVADFSNANPLSSALVEATGPRQAFGVLPPYVQMLASQVAEQNIFTGEPWRTEGVTQSRVFTEEGFTNRMRIAANDALGLLYPYRFWEQTAYKGEKQGADTLAWDPRPLKYASEEGQAEQRRRKREYAKRDVVREELLPMLPAPTKPLLEQNRRITKARTEEERQRRRYSRGSSGSSSSGGSSGGGVPWGSGSSSSSGGGGVPWG